MKKKFLIILLFILIVFILTMTLISQERNPILLIKGIIELNTGNEEFIKLSENPIQYICKVEKGEEKLINFMKNDGWKFIEQNGSGYFFKKKDKSIIIKSSNFTKRYLIWKIE